MNLSYEHKFIKDMVLRQHREVLNQGTSQLLKLSPNDCFAQFTLWMADINASDRYDKSVIKFGNEI